MATTRDRTKGFTIIEVVLVLAIAGLIFLVVFLALPALQKSQRDNARKQDVAKVIAGLQNYKTDNNNQWPSGIWIPATGYFTGLAQVSGGSPIYIVASGACGQMSMSHTYYLGIEIGCTCDQVTAKSGAIDKTAKSASVYMRLENGGTYCQET